MEEEVGRRVGPSSNSGDSPGPANQASEVWKLLGRDTPGGKALFNIYGGNAAGRNAGQQYHERNKTVHDKKMASGWAPKPLESPKIEAPRPQVNYPKFGGPKYNVDPGAARLRAIPRRKQAEVILKELREEEERLRALPPPRPRGPLLDEKEKARLAELMRFRGRVPDVTPEDRAEAARHRGAASKPRTRREELQRMFDAVSDEVEERRTFLQEMEALGALTRDHVHQIHAEIKLRVADMQRIDWLLQQEAGDE